MKKTVKKIIMGLVAGAIAVSCGGFSVAAQESDDFLSGDFYYDYLFRETGVSVPKLQSIEEELGADLYDYFGIELPTKKDYENFMNYREDEDISLHSTFTYDADYIMPASKWNALYKVAEPSDILVTKDCTTATVDHGHSALVYGDGYTIEHYGYRGIVEGSTGLSDKEIMERFWIHCQSCRLYEVSEVKNDYLDEEIVQYAEDNLIGLSYAPLARLDVKAVNCATLIWKAYNSVGIDLGGHWNDTRIPSDYVEHNELYMVFSTGWGHTKPYVWK